MLPLPLSNVLKTKLHHCHSLCHYLPTRPWINLTPSEEGRFAHFREGAGKGRGDAHPVRKGTRQPQAVGWPSTITTTPTEKLISLMENRHISYLQLLQISCLLSTLLGGEGVEGVWILDVSRKHLDAAQQKRFPGKCLLLSPSLPAQAVQEREELGWEDVRSRQRIPPSSFSINSASPVAQDYDQKGWILPDLLNFSIVFGGGMQHFTHMHRLPF